MGEAGGRCSVAHVRKRAAELPMACMRAGKLPQHIVTLRREWPGSCIDPAMFYRVPRPAYSDVDAEAETARKRVEECDKDERWQFV